ncbi:LPS biosynthesis choline kinase [Nostoc sp. T09]|uniref:phosphotransferase family protein n=1 Tax=Nostoc sp. T09 TaxID=1932621 RepID=UPI000A36E813|nr:aminoglycoside phosphotransferase family protein [Nostoc sp. T09]OUL28972.1 LPS biosynthesis choline kinase [Nostoc sp. T09]
MELLLSPQNLFEYLIDRDICTHDDKSMSKIEIKPAKNFNLLLTLPEGRQLLIKQERRSSNGKTAGEFLREWQIQSMLQTFPQLSHIRFSVSEAIYFDAENAIIVFNYLNDYRDLADFYTKENIFPTKIAASIGANLALIHSLTRDNYQYEELFKSGLFVNNDLKFVQSVNRLTPELFSALSTDALKFFAVYQRYDSLRQAIAQLIDTIESFCLTHNDLKLNNILLANNWEEKVSQASSAKNIVRLIDWEKCTWGDPAYDLGMLIASYLQAWLLSLMTSKTISLEETLRLAKTPLELVQPSIAALMKAYLKNFPEILKIRSDFLSRVVQFTGLGLVLTIIATLQHHKTFGNQGICMLQVAKSLLCRPEQSIPTVFGVTAVELAHRPALRAIK